MEVTATNTDGLKRTLNVVVPAAELNARFGQRLGEVKDQVQLKGFRKGKVPVAHLKRVYGRSVMLEVLEQAVRDTSTQAIADRKERPALQPDIKLSEDQTEIERIIEGKADLAYSMSFEVLPEITLADFSGLQLEQLVADVDDEALEKALTELADRSVTFEDEAGRAAAEGDRVTIDFVGKIDGETFDGGTGENTGVVIGQGGFIPGFEDGLKGAKAGDERLIKATFPTEYPVKELAGKEAHIETKGKGV